MTLFEEYLSLGYWLNDDQKLAIYKYLLKTKRVTYKSQANKLFKEEFLLMYFANGEIAYSIHGNKVIYKEHKIGDCNFGSERRSVKLSKVKKFSVCRLTKFFAQVEVDILRNYPIPKEEELEERGYAMNVFPYYDLNYYSNGAGKVRGLLSKIQYKNDELFDELLASLKTISAISN